MESKSALLEESEDISIPFTDDQQIKKDTLRHPYAACFHLFFRTAALIIYLFCGWFSTSFISSFVLVVIFLSLDFWTVKNITGRILVGLRWWNYVDDEGKSIWMFESRKDDEIDDTVALNSTEVRIFWIGLVVFPLIWLALMFVTIFGLKFHWFVLVCIGIVLHGANLFGYVRCKIKNRKKLGDVASRLFSRQIFNSKDTAAGKVQS